MRDTDKILRYAIAQALNGTVNVSGVIPVFDEKKRIISDANLYILLSTQRQVPQDTHDTWIMDSYIDIEICHKTGSEVSKDTMDDVANAVLMILFPTRITQGIINQSNAQVNIEFESSITRNLEISPTESIIRKIITIKASIVQQS